MPSRLSGRTAILAFAVLSVLASAAPRAQQPRSLYDRYTEPIKIFEVTRDKKIVWTYTGKHKAHEIQVLTTNGQPVEGKPLK